MTTRDLDLHRYHFETHGPRTLLLLHGTGGDEHDLVPLARRVAPEASLLSPRGNVLENGMPRFFRRLAEGVFDLEDLARRTAELGRWLRAAVEHHQIDPAGVCALGFSNGANIAANLLLSHADGLPPLAGAILIRAMVTAEHAAQGKSLAGVPILMLSGARDAIIPVANSRRLESMLEERGASVEHIVRDVSHQLDHGDLSLAHEWAQRHRVLDNR